MDQPRSQKVLKENERRAITNTRFEELRVMLNAKDDTNLSQDQLLKLSLEEATRLDLESSRGPTFSGSLEGLEAVFSPLLIFITTVETDEDKQSELIKKYREFYERQRLTYYGIASSSVKQIPQSRYKPRTIDVVNNPEDSRREKRKTQEQERRDRIAAGFDGLLDFIQRKGLSKSKKIEKLQILEIVIDYIQAKSNVINGFKTSKDYCQGVLNGMRIAKEWAVQFFNNFPKFQPLEIYLDSFLNSQSLQGFPLVQQAPLMPTIPNLMTMLQLQNPFPFPVPMLPIARSAPIGSIGFPTPPPSTDPSTSSSPIDKVNTSNPSQEVKFFRPWC